jgi:hypothetical protein
MNNSENNLDILNGVEKEGFDLMIERFLDDGVIDSDEIIELVQFLIEFVEKKKELSGIEKKNTVMIILKKFIENSVTNWEELEKIINKTIDFSIDISKNGINKIIISSIAINDTKSAFNLIYSSTISKINEKYPLADDIINNLFDITKYVFEMISNQTIFTENEKKIFLKKILNKMVDTVNINFSDEQKQLLRNNIDSTISLIIIGWRFVKPEEVVSKMKCIFGWMSKCC